MESKLCKNFSIGNPVTAGNTFPVNGNLNFTADFWQPFIDTLVISNATQICGPLIGIAFEISRKLKVSLTYFPTKGDGFDNDLEMMENDEINIMFYPLVPSKMIGITSYIELSHSIGEVKMISILSAKGDQIKSSFQMLKAFTIPVWILVVISYVFSASIASLIGHTNKPFVNYLALFFRQQLSKFDRNESTSTISLIWLICSSILTWALSSAILMFLVFSFPHEKIDSMADLANKQIEFTVLKGESALDYVKDPNEQLTQLFAYKYVVEDPPTETSVVWENQILTKISSGNYALVSDQAFLDYYFAKQLINYPNLYRSKENLLTLPYFIPITKHNSPALIRRIKDIIVRLIESGIYDGWTRDTLALNNVAVRNGLVELEDRKCEFLPIFLGQFEGIFYIQITGFCISSLILIIECFLLKYRKQKIPLNKCSLFDLFKFRK